MSSSPRPRKSRTLRAALSIKCANVLGNLCMQTNYSRSPKLRFPRRRIGRHSNHSQRKRVTIGLSRWRAHLSTGNMCQRRTWAHALIVRTISFKAAKHPLRIHHKGEYLLFNGILKREPPWMQRIDWNFTLQEKKLGASQYKSILLLSTKKGRILLGQPPSLPRLVSNPQQLTPR